MKRAFPFGNTAQRLDRPRFGETTTRLDEPPAATRTVRATEPIPEGWRPASPCHPEAPRNAPAPPPPGPPPRPPSAALAWVVLGVVVLLSCACGAWLLYTLEPRVHRAELPATTSVEPPPAVTADPPTVIAPSAAAPSASATAPKARVAPRVPSSAPRQPAQPARPPLPFNDIRNPWGYE